MAILLRCGAAFAQGSNVLQTNKTSDKSNQTPRTNAPRAVSLVVRLCGQKNYVNDTGGKWRKNLRQKQRNYQSILEKNFKKGIRSVGKKNIFKKTLILSSQFTLSALSISLVACAGNNGLGSNTGAKTPTSVLEKAGGALKIEKINGINIISKASIESYLNDLKTNTESQAAKSFQAMKNTDAVDYVQQSWTKVTNEPLEVMGFRFENLADWGTALQEQVQLSMSEFSTMNDYLKSGGINSADDLEIESIEDSLLAAEEFFAQDPVAWLQNNQASNEQSGLALYECRSPHINPDVIDPNSVTNGELPSNVGGPSQRPLPPSDIGASPRPALVKNLPGVRGPKQGACSPFSSNWSENSGIGPQVSNDGSPVQ